jgi:hypothetical protein
MIEIWRLRECRDVPCVGIGIWKAYDRMQQNRIGK